MGYNLAQRSVDGESNEISAVQQLLEELEISSSLMVADSLNCQKNVKIIIVGEVDYLLCTKDNQETLEGY